MPLEVGDDVTGLGDAASKGSLTVLVFPGPPSTFKLHDDDDALTTITAHSVGTGAEITIYRALRPVILRVRADAAPASVTVDGAPAVFVYDATTRNLTVKVTAGAAHVIATQ